MQEILIGGGLLIAAILLSWPKRQQSTPVRRSASTIIREQKQTNLQQRITKQKIIPAEKLNSPEDTRYDLLLKKYLELQKEYQQSIAKPSLSQDEILLNRYPYLRTYYNNGYRFTDYELLTMELPDAIHLEE